LQTLKKIGLALVKSVRLLVNKSSREEVVRQFDRMRSEGVDASDPEARRAWIRAHREELKTLQRPTPPKQPVNVFMAPKTGRNGPCPCGSGRKFKKCCGNKP